PIGEYTVRFFRGDVAIEQTATVLMDQTVPVNVRMPAATEKVKTIAVTQRAPAIDLGSTRLGATLTSEFAANLPNSLSLSGLMEKAPGASSDPAGLSLSGGTGLENAYFVDGLNITGLRDGALGTNLFVPFLDEVEVSSGGYGAEYGRAMGGVVNIATKSGTNEWHGSAFSYVAPAALSGLPRHAYSHASVLSGVTEPDYTTNIGAEAGGPLIKNRLFIWVGYSPEITRNHFVQYADRFVEHVDPTTGTPDGTRATNPDGTPVTVPLYRRSYSGETTTQHYAGKLTWKFAPEQTLTLGLYGISSQLEGMRGANMDALVGMTNEKTRTNDITARWMAAFFDRRWRLDGTLGMHIEQYDRRSPFQDAENLVNINWLNSPTLGAFNPNVADRCLNNDITQFQSCPVQGYQSGGYGVMRDVDAFRLAGQIKSTNVFHGGGLHEVKYGLDGEFIQYRDARWSSGPLGGRAAATVYGDSTYLSSLFRLAPGVRLPDADPNNPSLLSTAASPYYQDVIDSKTTQLNTALFLQESYSPLPYLTLNLGVRWEMQQIYDYHGDKALSINDNIAPRLGVIFDPTREGRSKIFVHYGRTYESIPMDLSNRAFGGEGTLRSVGSGPTLAGSEAYGATAGETIAVQKGIKGSFNHEVVAGGQYQLMPDLTVGGAFIYRWLGRVIEDTFDPSDPNMVMLGNPGSVSQGQSEVLEQNAQIAEQLAAQDPTDANKQAASQARTLANNSQPKPTRTYQAVQVSASKRFARRWFVTGSYTYSRLRGNYVGLYDADNSQADPNLTRQYDQPGIMVNRSGPLPNDHPHLIRLDGYYIYPLERSSVTTGLSFVGRSGSPISAIGHSSGPLDYDAYFTPRGSMGRTPFVTRFDLHVAYRRGLQGKLSAEAFLDVFNLLNQRTVLTQDQVYSEDPGVVPVANASLKAYTNPDGTSSVTKNPNFLMPTSYQAPISGRVGVRVFF
ncbi:MAG TPA: hypothetical protein VF518_09835, partial [Polyangia bacterium]